MLVQTGLLLNQVYAYLRHPHTLPYVVIPRSRMAGYLAFLAHAFNADRTIRLSDWSAPTQISIG